MGTGRGEVGPGKGVGELVVEVTDDLDVTLIGTASRVYAGELDAGFTKELSNLTE